MCFISEHSLILLPPRTDPLTSILSMHRPPPVLTCIFLNWLLSPVMLHENINATSTREATTAFLPSPSSFLISLTKYSRTHVLSALIGGSHARIHTGPKLSVAALIFFGSSRCSLLLPCLFRSARAYRPTLPPYARVCVGAAISTASRCLLHCMSPCLILSVAALICITPLSKDTAVARLSLVINGMKLRKCLLVFNLISGLSF